MWIMLLILLKPSSVSIEAPMEVKRVYAIPNIYKTEAACLNDTLIMKSAADTVYDCIQIKREKR
jgi:hypothetical protein